MDRLITIHFNYISHAVWWLEAANSIILKQPGLVHGHQLQQLTLHWVLPQDKAKEIPKWNGYMANLMLSNMPQCCHSICLCKRMSSCPWLVTLDLKKQRQEPNSKGRSTRQMKCFFYLRSKILHSHSSDFSHSNSFSYRKRACHTVWTCLSIINTFGSRTICLNPYLQYEEWTSLVVENQRTSQRISSY